MAKYSIHRCLSELKTLDARIKRAINGGKYISRKKKSAPKVIMTTLTVEEFGKTASAAYDSATALIKRRADIKNAIVISNATTYVEIAGEKMTVAEAIERKTSIDYDKKFLKTLQNQYDTVLADVNRSNESMESDLNEHISDMLGSDKTKIDATLITTVSETYRAQNEMEIINPLDLKNIIDEMTERIERFESEVDYKLSTSNSITEVDIAE